jgi:hypothetical protein
MSRAMTLSVTLQMTLVLPGSRIPQKNKSVGSRKGKKTFRATSTARSTGSGSRLTRASVHEASWRATIAASAPSLRGFLQSAPSSRRIQSLEPSVEFSVHGNRTAVSGLRPFRRSRRSTAVARYRNFARGRRRRDLRQRSAGWYWSARRFAFYAKCCGRVETPCNN